jgi:hypothetical protein
MSYIEVSYLIAKEARRALAPAGDMITRSAVVAVTNLSTVGAPRANGAWVGTHVPLKHDHR